MSEANEVARAVPADGEPPGEEVGVRTPVLRHTGGLDGVVRRHRALKAEREALAPGTELARGESEQGQATMQPLSIIVIDDEADQVDLTVMLLQTRGHKVVGTTDGSQAVELVAGEDASVLVLDFMLGRMTGGDVCQALRAEARTQDVRIVLLSGTPEFEIRQSCTQYDTYLRKPPTSNALFKAVESLDGRDHGAS